MTTTLRPAGPEERTAAGTRSRAYDICVNARAVGTVRLSTGEQHGPRTGWIGQLAVDPAERRRGRATVALLAAEEVLRDWGCDRVESAVPAGSAGALSLAFALGHREGSRGMVKELAHDDEPSLPPGSEGRPMTEADYTAWRERDSVRQVEIQAERGLPAREAQILADRAHSTLLPGGPETPGMVMRVLTRDGTDVGTVWIRVDGAPRPGVEGWVYAVEVEEALRGRGHGRALMLLAEVEARTAGVRLLGLNVYTDNAPALHLYESLGYRPLDHQLYKRL
ncbi:GNAT family N-acetyltransferase [Streptomyces sp. N2-109]|uniref:GNAT family N-acetyltransferase n=1 Tax=Streptomyces gossypii TaxID=2883101 RepID=A0ABT2JL58_9ACTN|nr:GNAT family N-acetyltransferase [Streptomyces gossypii]MCT2588608.1 GNAT family N-acetyltransferase [Streptomyces gossypii]